MSRLIYGPRREKTCLRRFAKQHMHRPACTSAQSDQRLCYSLLESIISKFATSAISIFYLVSVAEETGLKLALSETPNRGFLATRPILLLTRRSPNCALILFGLSLAAWAKYDLANSRFFSPPSVYFIWNRKQLALTLCMLGNFSCFFCRLLIFFKINFFEKLFQEHYQSVKQFGSRPGPTFSKQF